MKEKKLLYTVICVLIVAVIVSFVQLDDLRADIASLKNTVSNNEHRLEQKISSIYDNVDAQMKEQASLFSNVSHSLGTLDKESATAVLELSVVPKTVTDGMSVRASVGGKSAEMARTENGKYIATLPVGLFEEYDTYPLIEIRSENETKTEYLETVAVSYLWPNYLPMLDIAEILSDSIIYEEGGNVSENSVTVKGYIEFSYKSAEKEPKTGFEKFYVTAENENGEIARKDITSLLQNPEYDDTIALSAPFREIYEIGESEELCLYIVAEDTLGYTHKVQALVWTRPDEDGNAREPDNAPEWAGVHDRGERIYNKEGKLLFGDEF